MPPGVYAVHTPPSSAESLPSSEVRCELSPTPSRCSSRLSTDTFGFCRPDTPSMTTSAPESWKTAHQSSSQITITCHNDEEDQVASKAHTASPSSISTLATTPTPHHIQNLPELSRSTSTVNPATPSTICFPRLDNGVHKHRDTSGSEASRRSGSMSSIKEMLMDETDSNYENWHRSRSYSQDGHIHKHPMREDSLHLHHGHVRSVSVSSTTDAAEWEDIDTSGKEEGGAISPVTDDDSDESLAWTSTIPTPENVRDAAGCHVVDQWGKAVRFGDMLPGGPAWRSATIAGQPVTKLLTLFVGHWWCGLCHDYALWSVSKLSPAALVREGVRVVIISSGSWKVIAKYRELFDVKFPVFVDNGTRLYKALGLRTATPNPFSEAKIKDRPKYHKHAFMRQMVTGMAKGIFRLGGIKLQHPGSFTQLGGEFVFGNDFTCDYAHRMTGRGDHCEAPEILGAVGVQGTLGEPISSAEKETRDRQLVRNRLNRTRPTPTQ